MRFALRITRLSVALANGGVIEVNLLADEVLSLEHPHQRLVRLCPAAGDTRSSSAAKHRNAVGGYYAPNGVWVAGFWRAPAIGVAVAPRLAAPHYFAYNRGLEARHDFGR